MIAINTIEVVTRYSRETDKGYSNRWNGIRYKVKRGLLSGVMNNPESKVILEKAQYPQLSPPGSKGKKRLKSKQKGSIKYNFQRSIKLCFKSK